MLAWPSESINWVYCLLAVAAVSALALRWLTRTTSRAGSAGWITDVGLPFALAGATLVFFPALMTAFGLGGRPYQAAAERLVFRAILIGLLFDQSSWLQWSTQGLRGRRSSWPVWLWGGGFLVLMLAPLASHYQNPTLAWIDRSLVQAEKQLERERLQFDPHQWDEGLSADWGLGVAEVGLALLLVGAFALIGQSVIWVVRIGHAYLARAIHAQEEGATPPPLPGCLQSLVGFVSGAAGAAWLVWTTVPLLRAP